MDTFLGYTAVFHITVELRDNPPRTLVFCSDCDHMSVWNIDVYNNKI
jgi:hypothetical protein